MKTTFCLSLISLLSMTALAEPRITPNLINCEGGKTQIQYSTSSITGQPMFSVTTQAAFDRTIHRSLMGDQIRNEKTSIGELIGATIQDVPDYASWDVRLVLPVIQLKDSADTQAFNTFAVVTKNLTTFDGLSRINGPLTIYTVVNLNCQAKNVQF